MFLGSELWAPGLGVLPHTHRAAGGGEEGKQIGREKWKRKVKDKKEEEIEHELE